MKKSKIMFDKTEIVAYATILGDLNKKSYKLLNLTFDKFTRIEFVPCKERKLFRTLESEKIVLTIKGYKNPIIFYKVESGAFFDEYKKGFEKFATDNKITFVDKTQQS